MMKTMIGCLLFSLTFVLAPGVFAQDDDRSSSGSGVLVSGSGAALDSSDQGLSNGSGHRADQHRDGDDPAQDTVENGGDSGDVSNPPTDEIVVKATDSVMFQITANMKLTTDQISAIRPIITDYIVKVRDLQQSVEKGDIDSKAMYTQKLQLIADENQGLSRILTADQMKVWTNMQVQ